jgi:hypothetical protein
MDGWMDGIKLLAEFVMESSSRPCVLVDEMFVTEAFAAKVLGFYNACTDWCVCVCVCWGGRRAAGDIMPDDSSSSTSHLLFFFTPSQQPPRAEGKKKNKRQANGKNKRGTFTFFSSETEIGIILLSAAPRVHRLIGLFFRFLPSF